MCGIAGTTRSDGPVEAMIAHLAHRGPDARTFWRDEGVAFGHARLSIIDLEGGAQPYASEDGQVVGMFNGEIYNFRELRAELEAKGHRFRSRADGEVIVHLYEEMGDACVERLRGMFALAVWDRRKRRLLLARDRLGVKPLHIMVLNEQLVFASEAQGLGMPPSLFYETDLVDFLAYGYLPEKPGQLPPGSRLVWEDGKGTLTRYWTRERKPELLRNRREAVEELDRLLNEAVRLRLVSDVPVGAFLSGGLDSSLVTALMRKNGASDLHTFSVGVSGLDESAWARKAADLLGTTHHQVSIGPEVLDQLPEAMAHLDEPLADPAYLPNLILARLARKTVKVCLSGDGADEAFLGYRRYAWIREYGRSPVDALPAEFRRTLFGPLGLRRWAGEPWQRYADILLLSTPEEIRELMLVPSGKDPRGHLRSVPWEGDLALAAQALDYRTYLPDDILAKVDRSSMAVSLEVRSPFLDQALQEFILRLPEDWLMDKSILKEVALRHLPPEIVHRPKQGFDLPLAAWLGGGQGRALLARCGDPSVFFHPSAVESLVRRTEGGDARAALQFWTMACWVAWARSHGVIIGS